MSNEESNTKLNSSIMLVNQANTVSITNDQHGQCLVIKNKSAHAKISLFGGHVLSFVPLHDGIERLWLSENAIFDGKTPIRGGIPICWPWFSGYIASDFTMPLTSIDELPSHGFARTQFWHVCDISESNITESNITESNITESNITEHELPSTPQSTTITLRPNQLGKYGVTCMLSVKLVIEISATLTVSLITSNDSENDIQITQALHSYFAIPNIHTLLLSGVTEPYADKPSNTNNNPLNLPYIFDAEVDRIHMRNINLLEQAQTIELFDSPELSNSLERHLSESDLKASAQQNDSVRPFVSIQNNGNDSVVIWNPWAEKSSAMQDMAANSYCTMVCVEAANTRATTISPAKSTTLVQRIS